MPSFSEIPKAILALVSIIIILIIGAIIFVNIGDSGILPEETWTNVTATAGANGTWSTGFRLSLPHDSVKSIELNRANTTSPIPTSNYTEYKQQGYVYFDGRADEVKRYAGLTINITGTYYNDTMLDYGTDALDAFGSWLGIMVVIMLAAVIFGLFKYFGRTTEGEY